MGSLGGLPSVAADPDWVFALLNLKNALFTAQASRESDLGISMKCVHLTPDDIAVFVIAFSPDRGRARANSAFQ